MALPPKPKSRLLVRRALAASTLAACVQSSSGRHHGVPPQVVRHPDHDRQVEVAPQVNCAGIYAGECTGVLEIVVLDPERRPLANRAVLLSVRNEPQPRATTDAQGMIVIGGEPGQGLSPGPGRIKLDVEGFLTEQQDVSIGQDRVRVEVVLQRPVAL